MNNNFYVEVGKALQEARQSKNYSQQDVADRLKVSRSTVASWEQGRRSIYMDDLYRIADILGVDVNDLVKTARKYLFK